MDGLDGTPTRGVATVYYASLKRKSTRPNLMSALKFRATGDFPVSFCWLRKVKLVLFSSSSIYWPFSTKMCACRRETPPSSPPCGVRSTSGKMLLTASSRPIRTLSLPLRSNSWLSASTTSRAVSAGAAAATGAALIAGAGSASVGAAAAAGVEPLSGVPQLEQNDSPAGFTVLQDVHACGPAPVAGAGAATGALVARASPPSSQKRDPSGFPSPQA